MNKSSPVDIECNCCYENYNIESNYPRMMTHCGHSVCTKCLKNIIAKKISEGQSVIECPYCKTEHKFCPSEVASLVSFPKNFYLADLINALMSEKRKIRPIIIRQDDENYLCRTHNKNVTLLSKKTHEFICVDCFLESHEASEVLKLTELKNNAFEKMDKLFTAFANFNSNVIGVDFTALTSALSQSKQKVLKKLKDKYQDLHSYLDNELLKEQNKINNAYQNLEYICNKSGLFKQNISSKIEADLKVLEKVKQEFDSEHFSLDRLKFIQFAEQFDSINILSFGNTLNVVKEMSAFVDVFKNAMKSNVENLLLVSPTTPLKIELKENALSGQKYKELLDREIVIEVVQNKTTIQAVFTHLLMVDAITELTFVNAESGVLEIKCRCISHTLPPILNLLEQSDHYKAKIKIN
jgi:hypothetical protein